MKAISGVMTVRFKNELVRNITIKLGYANAKVRIALSPPRGIFDRWLCRFTSAKTKHVRDQAATAHIAQIKKTTPRVNAQDAATE